MIKPVVVGFCSIRVDATLGLKTLAQFQGNEMSLGLFQNFMDTYIRLCTLAVEHSVVVMTGGSQSKSPQVESNEWAIFNSHFMKFVFRIRESIKLSDPS